MVNAPACQVGLCQFKSDWDCYTTLFPGFRGLQISGGLYKNYGRKNKLHEVSGALISTG